MTVFEEENKGKRSRPNREVIIYSLLNPLNLPNPCSISHFIFTQKKQRSIYDSNTKYI